MTISPLRRLAGASGSLHRHSVRPRRSGCERVVEVDVEAAVELQAMLEHLDHAHVVIAFEMDLAEVVLVEEVIADDQALVVVGQLNHVRSCIEAEVDDACLDGMLRIADIEHADLTGLKTMRKSAGRRSAAER